MYLGCNLMLTNAQLKYWKKYTSTINDCTFTASCLESVQCIGSQYRTIRGCMHDLNRIINNINLTSELNGSSSDQDISSLITQSQRSRAP